MHFCCVLLLLRVIAGQDWLQLNLGEINYDFLTN